MLYFKNFNEFSNFIKSTKQYLPTKKDIISNNNLSFYLEQENKIQKQEFKDTIDYFIKFAYSAKIADKQKWYHHYLIIKEQIIDDLFNAMLDNDRLYGNKDNHLNINEKKKFLLQLINKNQLENYVKKIILSNFDLTNQVISDIVNHCNKYIKVVIAIIYQNNKILVAQRNYGEFDKKWELPGGKLELDENAEEALNREMQEELKIKVNIKHKLNNFKVNFANMTMEVFPIVCELPLNEKLNLSVHDKFDWINSNEYNKYDFLPVDKKIIMKSRRH